MRTPVALLRMVPPFSCVSPLSPEISMAVPFGASTVPPFKRNPPRFLMVISESEVKLPPLILSCPQLLSMQLAPVAVKVPSSMVSIEELFEIQL